MDSREESSHCLPVEGSQESLQTSRSTRMIGRRQELMSSEEAEMIGYQAGH